MRRPITLLALALFSAGAAAADDVPAGEKLFQSSCAMCHQAQAQGMPGLAPPLTGSHWSKLARARNYVPGVLLAGMNGSLALDGATFTGVMPTQNRLGDDEIAALANYLFIGVNGQAGWQPLTAAEVAALRKDNPGVAGLRAMRKGALAQ